MRNKKVNFSLEDVVKLAKLAKLQLTSQEAEKYYQQLKETLEYVKNLDELNFEKGKKKKNPLELSNVFFEDGEKNQRQLSFKDALKNARKKKGGYFVVEKIL